MNQLHIATAPVQRHDCTQSRLTVAARDTFQGCRRAGMAACLVALSSALCSAGLAASTLERIDVRRSDGRYQLSGEVLIDATRASVFAVITDYDGLAALDEGIADSHIVERINATTTLVYTRLTGCVLLFCRDVERIERVEELSDSEIVARVVPDPAHDIRFSQSRWQLSTEAGGTRVHYETEVDPAFWVPPLIGPSLVQRVLRQRVAGTLANIEQAARKRDMPAPL